MILLASRLVGATARLAYVNHASDFWPEHKVRISTNVESQSSSTHRRIAILRSTGHSFNVRIGSISQIQTKRAIYSAHCPGEDS